MAFTKKAGMAGANVITRWAIDTLTGGCPQIIEDLVEPWHGTVLPVAYLECFEAMFRSP